ncbi:glycine zipper 2TM domain-containing protein [Sphingomonas bacterium]|uniref:glycine zipper 2TM domain-containing protein n=1 Tax=Sphingomonas bacterium TaxID=1895847 RepID=UPI0015757BAF|nr:glycine zipper 2TM domain-containing protein [Sphingomonas bacterium]
MFTRLLTAAAAIATLATAAAPALAQSSADDARFRAAQERFDREYQIFRQETDRYQSSRGRGGYNNAPPQGAYRNGGYEDDRYDPNYDPSRYYRRGGSTTTLAENDRVYAGQDGRYYCKRSDGTTGLIIGAAGGGVLGNVIDGGHSRTVGTLLGAALGGLAGRAVDQNNAQVRCQ